MSNVDAKDSHITNVSPSTLSEDVYHVFTTFKLCSQSSKKVRVTNNQEQTYGSTSLLFCKQISRLLDYVIFRFKNSISTLRRGWTRLDEVTRRPLRSPGDKLRVSAVAGPGPCSLAYRLRVGLSWYSASQQSSARKTPRNKSQVGGQSVPDQSTRFRSTRKPPTIILQPGTPTATSQSTGGSHPKSRPRDEDQPPLDHIPLLHAPIQHRKYSKPLRTLQESYRMKISQPP